MHKFSKNHIALQLVQLAGTLVAIAFVPNNFGKLITLLVWWIFTFRYISRPELVMFAVASGFFTIMNTLSLRQGIFSFAHPNVLGMPVYELFMWGFYLLHTKRMVNGPAPEGRRTTAWMLALLYSIAFSTIPNQTVLLAVTALLLIVGLIFFHEPLDLAYTGYMILLGAAIEYTGVLSGQWFYPGAPIGGVPLWFITLWGGVGLFLRRLVLPILARYEPHPTSTR